MNNSKTLFQEFVNQITIKESQDEIQSMGYAVFEKVFNLSLTDILADKSIPNAMESGKRLENIIARLNKNEPLQYIFGEAEFYGRTFKVNSAVLIPRPETEEMVSVIVSLAKDKAKLSILDIGTGSGCIAITLALELIDAKVDALDISNAALIVAKANASNLRADVTFIKHDILSTALLYTDLDIIVSNPPYIPILEQDGMSKNVKNYEPHLALFVPNHDPLRFYKAIAIQAKKMLKPSGLLIVEINALYGDDVVQLFSDNDFIQIEIIKDLSGKDRIVKGILS